MEQNLVSDEELIERINKVVHESKQDSAEPVSEFQQEETSGEKFHDVSESAEQVIDCGNIRDGKFFGAQKNLVLENHYLSLQLQAEKKKSKELQSKFKLFENSLKYFERLNGQLETIKKAVDEECIDLAKNESASHNFETMQQIRPKNIHTATSGIISGTEEIATEAVNFSEPHSEGAGKQTKEEKEEVTFRDAEDFKQLEQGLEIIKDKQSEGELETEKVFITKTEKRCLEDIGNIAARTRAPLDDKHQKFFERDRRRFANSITMPDIQEVDKGESVPLEIISKTKETPVNITSTELDGLRSYLLQLKELIARRETAWARTTERDYHQRVEITRFKNEVTHLRMLCEKRQKDIKERDQIIATKEEEIRELQKRIQGLRSAIMKLEKKDERLMDTIDGMTNEVLENSQLVQRSYNAMKRQSMMTRANRPSSINIAGTLKPPANVTQAKPLSRSKEGKKSKPISEKNVPKKVRISESTSNDEEIKYFKEKPKQKVTPREKSKTRQMGESLIHKTKEAYDKVDEKLQRVEEMLHSEVLKGSKRSTTHGRSRNIADIKSLIKNSAYDKNVEFSPSPLKKLTPSNSTIRQEMLTAMTGLNMNANSILKNPNFSDSKKSHMSAAVIANALLAAKNTSVFNY